MDDAATPLPLPCPDTGNTIADRILGVAFRAFTEGSYARTSMLEIARRARISKRDLYAHFPNKQAVLAACIRSRAKRMVLVGDQPAPRSRGALAETLTGIAETLLREMTHRTVLTMFRLAIAEADRSPEIAQALEAGGRQATRQAISGVLSQAQACGVLPDADPTAMTADFLSLMWEDLMLGLLLGVAAPPDAGEIRRRAGKATAAFLRLYAAPMDRLAASHA